MIDCNEWKTEKHHECTNMGASKTTRIIMATVLHMPSSSGLREYQAAWFLLNSAVPLTSNNFTIFHSWTVPITMSLMTTVSLNWCLHISAACTPHLMQFSPHYTTAIKVKSMLPARINGTYPFVLDLPQDGTPVPDHVRCSIIFKICISISTFVGWMYWLRTKGVIQWDVSCVAAHVNSSGPYVHYVM